jgi:hypothetical protein
MKKFSILLVAAIMVLALTMPAAAFENEFGGYWRTRFFTQMNYSGTGDAQVTGPVTTYGLSSTNGTTTTYTPTRTWAAANNRDQNTIDTRTRLFYTAKFSENLKFVNKFEMNASWGGNASYGQVGADNFDRVKNSDGSGNGYSPNNNSFRVKASYVDFKLAEQRFTVGVQDFVLARGYVFADDAAGIKAIFKVNDAIYLPLIYMKMYEGGAGYSTSNGFAQSNSNYDLSSYVFYPTIFLNKDNTLKPHVAYITSENGSAALAKNNPILAGYSNALGTSDKLNLAVTQVDIWTAGLEYDGKIGIFDLGATGIFQFGDVRLITNEDAKLSGYLFDLFGGVNLGPANIHAKGIYASGKKHDDDSTDLKQFATFGPPTDWGTSYYWSEIMGAGIVDNQVPAGAPGDKISNVWIANLGASYKLLQDLKFSADLWYAAHVDSVAIKTPALIPQQYSTDLGTELDLVATYTIVDNLKLDLIGAYLWAGDCITKSVDSKGSANPMELAAQLSLAF